MTIRRELLLNLTQIVLVLVSCAMFLLSSGKIPANLGWSFPWYFSLLFFLGAIGCGYFAIKLSDKTEKQCAIVHMAGRPNLNDSEFGQHFFPPDRAEFAARLRQILSRHIAVDLSQMQPDDRLVEDLRMDAMDSLSTVEYVIEIEKEFEITIPNAAAEKMRTFQSVVDYVAGAVKAKEV